MNSSPQKIQTLIGRLPNAGGHGELSHIIDAFRETYDIQHVVYHGVNLGPKRENYAILTYSEAWKNRYIEKNYVAVDPVVLAAQNSFQPIEWKSLDWSSRPRKEFWRDAMRYGVGNQGYSIPIRGPNGQFALFTLNNSCDDDAWASFISGNAKDLLLVSHFFHQQVLQIENIRYEEPPATLSPRERDALTGLSKGQNRSQIAFDMSISENTLRVYIDSARHKLGALNVSHAVAIAINRGVINI
jgi:DNA-binding CsgD family transcriptional regulator